MANVVCKSCGSTVRIAGLAAICPHCGNLVQASDAPAQEVAQTAPEKAPVPAPPPRVEEVLLPPREIELAPVRPVIVPPIPALAAKKPSKAPIFILAGVLGAVIFGLLAAIAVLVAYLKHPMPPPLVIAPTQPAPIIVTTSRPATGGAGWFSETPATKPGEPFAQASPSPTTSMAIATPAPAIATSAPMAMAPTTAPAVPRGPHAGLARITVRIGDPAAINRVTDKQVADSITRGLTFLNSQFIRTRLKDADTMNPQQFAGLNALAIYAMLQGGKSMGDQRLSPETTFVNNLLDRLKDYPMNGNPATYSRSLRISALTVYNRPQDRNALEADFQWLMRASSKGAYTYDMPSNEQVREKVWDNSNSQYGALGVWAAGDTGFRAPPSYWAEVEQHWLAEQTQSGGWGYSPGSIHATVSMTAAGVNMLFVARDQISPSGYALSKPIQRALEWLDDGDNLLQIDPNHNGYTLYSIERAALASGYKFFGTHNWYEEFARKLIASQQADGSWTSKNQNTVVETSFNLLFLLRGRQPVFMSKLRIPGEWNERPRDVSALTRFASYQLERPLNWQFAPLEREWWEWSDAPVLFISSSHALKLSDDGVNKLREYALSGGMIFLHSEREGGEFDAFANDLAAQLFPSYPLNNLPPDHPIYSSVFPMEFKPELKGVSNGLRMLLVYSPTDLSRQWQLSPPKAIRESSDMGLNIVVYAAGKRDSRNRLDTMFVPPPSLPAVGTVRIARLKYAGNWDPEPAAWKRASRLLQTRTGIALDLPGVDLLDLKYDIAPIAHMTGTRAFVFTGTEAAALRNFVAKGGTLLIDSLGGSKPFTDTVETRLIPALADKAPLAALPPDHPLLLNSTAGMKDIHKFALRTGTPTDVPPLRYVRVGDGMILFSRLDLTSGLLGVNTVGIAGYEPLWAQDFADNLVLWTVEQIKQSLITR